MKENQRGTDLLLLDRGRKDDHGANWAPPSVSSSLLRQGQQVSPTNWTAIPCAVRHTESPTPRGNRLQEITGDQSPRTQPSERGAWGTIGQLVAAFRGLRWRARAQREVDQLSDRMLTDIGVRREQVGYSGAYPRWYLD